MDEYEYSVSLEHFTPAKQHVKVKVERVKTHRESTFAACLEEGATRRQDIFMTLPGPWAASNGEISASEIKHTDQDG